MPSPTVSPAPDTRTGALKRRIASLEDQNTVLLNKFAKKPTISYPREGRVIRRLVSLAEPVSDLIAEYDRRLLEVDDEDEMEHVKSSEKQERNFRSFKELIKWCPTVSKLLQVPPSSAFEIAFVCQELKVGADNARGDDTNLLKRSVATWLNERVPQPSPLIAPEDKQTRGFSHELTGGLICPVDYNWLDSSIRNAIRTSHANYPVTAYMWPVFLYENEQYNAQHPSSGLFKGDLLVRAFSCVFTSPSSAHRQVRGGGSSGQPRKAHRPSRLARPRCDVAGLLKMRSVEPRAIAYIAVQLRFALSSCASWDLVDDIFDYGLFYDNIVDWFEREPKSPARAQAINELLVWWNREVFGTRYRSAATVMPENLNIATSSVAVSMV